MPGMRRLHPTGNLGLCFPGCYFWSGLGELETGMSKNEQTCVNTLVAYALGGKQLSTNVNKMNSTESPFIQKRDDDIIQEVGDYAKKHTTTLTQQLLCPFLLGTESTC